MATYRERQDLAWNRKYELLRQYIIEFGFTPLKKTVYHGVRIGGWMFDQRTARIHAGSFGRHRMDALRIAKLDALPEWQWETTICAWRRQYMMLKEYSQNYGHLPDIDVIYKRSYIGSFLVHLRATQESLTPWRKILLEAIPHWTWDAQISASLNIDTISRL